MHSLVMRSVATITQPQGTPAVLAEALPFSGATTRVAGTPRALVGEGVLPAHMMVATGMPRSARPAAAQPLLTSRDAGRIVAVAALAALVAMAVAGLGRFGMGSDPAEPPEPVATPLPMPVPVAPECPAAQPPPVVKPPPAASPPKTTPTPPFVIPSTLPALPGLPGVDPPAGPDRSDR